MSLIASRPKKVALYVAMWLLVGAFVSLIQTWWVIHFYENTINSALRPALLRYPYTRPYDSWRSSWVVVDHGGEPLLVCVNRNRDGRVFQVRSSLMIQPDPDQSRNNSELPGWSLPERHSAVFPGRPEEIVLEQANGWPFIAWKGEYMYDMAAYASRWSWSIPDDWQDGLDAYQHVILFPYRPMFPGVLYNALLYGAGAWLGLRGLRKIRMLVVRSRRQYRQHCPGCGYDSKGLRVCPECGEMLGTDATVAS